VNAITPIFENELPRAPFVQATARVNEWRGRSLDSFARMERAVTECLAAMAAVDGRGQHVRLSHLYGQRFDALAVAIGADGPFEHEGGIARAALEQCSSHTALRNMLCHGVGNVTLDARGCWTLDLRMATFRSKRLERQQQVLTESEAEALREELARASKRLCSLLGKVRASLD